MKQFLKFLLILLPSLVVACNGYAQKPTSAKATPGKQGQALINSLLKEIPKQKEDTNKVKLLNNLSFDYSNINPDEGIKYGQQAMELATKLDWKKGIVWINNNLGVNYKNKSDYPKAMAYYNEALKIYEELDDKKDVLPPFGNIAGVYFGQSNYPKALEYFFKALKMAEKMGDKQRIARYTNNIGAVYQSQNDYTKALEYYFKAEKLQEGLGNKNDIANTTGNIGAVYCDGLKDYPKALEYMLIALKLYEELGYKSGIAMTTGNIGNVYLNQKNYTMAIEYMESSLKVAEEIGDKNMVLSNSDDIGYLYLNIIEDTALRSTSRGAGNVSGYEEHITGKYKPNGPIPVGKAALLREAIDYFQRGIALSMEINELQRRQQCYEGLARVYKLSGDYKKAMEYADNGRAIQDSVFSKKNSDKIVKMENDRKQYGDSLKAAATKRVADIKAQHERNYKYIGVGVIVLLLGFTFLLTRNNKLLGKEKKRSDDLLLNILPEEVASQLKDTGAAAARQFDDVTVLFTDFVNFTSAGERMSPQALIEELNTCFKAFDEITGKHNVEKIKTIGDAYLAVAGLPNADPKHAENVVRAAIDINAFMQNRLAKLGDRTFDIRIGIHSGSVVAGIVGLKKFAYDIWGDTVNTAARMEQNCEAGRINISQTTYELVKDKFTCEYRGEIDAKGKGQLKMYYVG